MTRLPRQREITMALTCDSCGQALRLMLKDIRYIRDLKEYIPPGADTTYPVEVYSCDACDEVYFSYQRAVQSSPYDTWVMQFPGLKAKTRELWKAIKAEFDAQQPPMTVRQMFYRMSTAGYVDKTESGYRQVQRCLLHMRRARAIPYHYIADNTRWQRKPNTYSSLEDAARFWARNYRRALWDEQPVYVEVWIEKDALAGVFMEVTAEYDVPLYVTRGYSSETLVYSAAEVLKEVQKPIYIYHFGDYDPSGRDMVRDLREKLRGFGVRCQFIEAAVTAEQVEQMQLPTRPTKKTDTRTKNWQGGESVELDAIPPATLRQMVRSVIEQHIDPDALEFTRRIEAEELARVQDLARGLSA